MRYAWWLAVVASAAACGDDSVAMLDAGVAIDAAVPPEFPAAVECAGDTELSGTPTLPRNIIVFLGDGMGPRHFKAGTIAARERGVPHALAQLAGPVYVNTDSITTDRAKDKDSAPPDSAANATALASGVRTFNEFVGVAPSQQPVQSIAELAADSGKAVGIVTTSFVYDASPAAFLAHTVDRDDEAGIVASVLSDAQPDVWFGAGRELIDGDASLSAQVQAEGYAVLRTDTELAAWDPSAQPRALGLFATEPAPVPGVYDWGLVPAYLRAPRSATPRLSEMTARALDRLDDDPDGLFLLVENEHADTFGHVGLAVHAREGVPSEALELDAAVRVALDWVAASSSAADTLIIVTADHETAAFVFDGEDLASGRFTAAPLHTRLPVPVYAVGPGADGLSRLCRLSDVFLLMTGRL